MTSRPAPSAAPPRGVGRAPAPRRHRRLPRGLEAQPLFATQVRAPAARARRRQERAALDPGGLAAAREVLGLGAMPDLRPALAARAGRARLVVGADDARFLAIARTLAHASPELRCDVVDGSGHDPTLEAPRALADVIARTLGQRSG
ncbi:MAG: hypothetical protein HS111_08430 [Kofleriaceae bacterium]|nr:hypothetical protein [Kofleriaceae bacterium]